MRKQNLFVIICVFFHCISLLGCNSAQLEEAHPKADFKWQLEDGKITITKYNGNSSDVVIPEHIQGYPVAEIGIYAFNNCTLTSVVIPEGIERIGDSAFNGNNLCSITIPSSITEISSLAFYNNPLKEVIIKTEAFQALPRDVFHRNLFGYLVPGTYVLGDDDNWFFRESNGSLLSMRSYQEKFKDRPGILAALLYDAIDRADTVQLRDCISLGADVKSGMLNGHGNTPLAEIIFYGMWRSFDNNRDEYLKRTNEIVTILLEAGAVPQYWMLCYSYEDPNITKMLLEYGALTNIELVKYGDQPTNYRQPESLLLDYCNNLRLFGSDWRRRDLLIVESATLLLEYGEDANYSDTYTGQTPLLAAMDDSVYGAEMAELLLKNISRPLTREEYLLLIGLNRKKVYTGRYLYQENAVDKEREDRFGFDTRVLEDIRKGLLNPREKDSGGKDIFDYALETGTAKLMEGLLPYLLTTGREIIAVNETGMYFDALNVGNFPVAAVLSAAVSQRLTEKNIGGNEYSLEYYAYDYDTIYYSAQRIPESSLYLTGPNGTRRISESQSEIDYSPNTFYALNTYSDLSLHTVAGERIDFNTLINTEREQYYREIGKEKPNNFNPRWHIARIFGDILYAYNRVYYDEAQNEYALVDISGDRPHVYILAVVSKIKRPPTMQTPNYHVTPV
jgi:hypothetical protein